MAQIGSYTIQQRLYGDEISYTCLASHGERQVEMTCFPVREDLEIAFYVRLQRELELIAALEDVPLLPIEETGVDAGVCYVVHPALGGAPLTEDQFPLSLEKTLYIARRISQALDALHRLGLVHGDLKPEHIRLDAQDQVYLTGYGRWKCLQAQASSVPHLVAGALGYRAPEYDIHDVEPGPAADVYSLGMLVFHLLSGQLPFQPHTPLGWATNHLLSPPADIREWRPGTPEHVAAALQRAMHKNPAQRFASAGDFLAALENQHPISVPGREKRQPYWAEHLERRVPRPSVWRKLALPLSMLGITVGLFLIVIGAWLMPVHLRIDSPLPVSAPQVAANLPAEGEPSPQVTHPPPTASPTPALPGDAAVSMVTPSPTVAASAQETETPETTLSPTPGPTATPWYTPLPTVALLISPSPESADYTIQYGDTLFDIAGYTRVALENLMGVNAMECSSRLYPGKSLLVPPPSDVEFPQPRAVLDTNTILHVDLLHAMPCTTDVADVAFSPDQQLLAVAQQTDILLWQLDAWLPLRRLREHRRPVTRIAFSPDSTQLVTGGVDGTLFVWQVSDGAVLWNSRAHRGEITDLAFSPAGDFLVSTSLDRTVRVWNTADWQVVHEESGYAAYSAAFSPDGSLLAVGYSDRVLLFSVDGFALVKELPATSVPHNLAFSHDGLLLASNGDMWQVADGRHIYQWPESTHRVAFTPDDLSLLIGRTVWQVSNGLQQGEIPFPLPISQRAAYAAESIAFSPDMRMLAIGNQDGAVVMALLTDAPQVTAQGRPYRLKEGDTFFNVAAAHDMPLSTFLSTNALSCDNVPFTNQLVHLVVPHKAWGSGLRVLDKNTFSSMQELTQLDMTCALPPGELRFSPASDALVSGLGMWKLAQGSLLVQGTDRGQLPLDEETAMPRAVLLFSPDGSLVAEPNENRILLWSSLDGRFQRALEGHTDRVTAMAFDLHGGVLASAGLDKTLRLWRVSDGTLLDTLPGYTAESLAFTPDGTTLLSVAGDTVRFWALDINDLGDVQASFLDKKSGTPHDSLPGVHWAQHLSPDGQYLGYVACEDGTVSNCKQQVLNLYSVQRGVIAHTFYGVKSTIQDFAFSFDASQVAIATDNAVVVWNIEDEERVQQFIPDRKWAEFVNTLFYTPDDAYLVTVGSNRRIRFWDVRTGDLISTLRVPDIRSVALSPDQHILAVLAGNEIELYGVLQK